MNPPIMDQSQDFTGYDPTNHAPVKRSYWTWTSYKILLDMIPPTIDLLQDLTGHDPTQHGQVVRSYCK